MVRYRRRILFVVANVGCLAINALMVLANGNTAMRLHSFINSLHLFALALCVLAALGLAATDLPAQSNNVWRTQSIYQIVTDRFYDGNPANDNVEGTYAPSNPTGVHGGDFAGLEQKLDYIKSLGATAIWISPIVLNTEGQFHGYSAW